MPSSIDFLNRYRPLPVAVYGNYRGDEDGDDENDERNNLPLMSRRDDVADGRLGETLAGLSRLERLLRCADPDAHVAIASELWRADSDADAVARLERVARESLEGWEERVRGGLGDDRRSSRGGGGDDDDEGLGGGGREGGGREPDDRDRGGKLGGAPGRGSMSRRRAKEQKERERLRLEKEKEKEQEVVAAS